MILDRGWGSTDEIEGKLKLKIAVEGGVYRMNMNSELSCVSSDLSGAL